MSFVESILIVAQEINTMDLNRSVCSKVTLDLKPQCSTLAGDINVFLTLFFFYLPFKLESEIGKPFHFSFGKLRLLDKSSPTFLFTILY